MKKCIKLLASVLFWAFLIYFMVCWFDLAATVDAVFPTQMHNWNIFKIGGLF